MKYKVGDKLRVKKDLIGGATYCMENRNNRNTVVSEMLQHCDNIATITHCYTTCYEIDLDKGEYAWTDEMFEDSTEKTQSVNKQEEIPYINATEAREIYDEHHSIDTLRKLVYLGIKELAPSQTSVPISVCGYPISIVDMMEKELKFKGFFVKTDKDIYNRDIMKVAW